MPVLALGPPAVSINSFNDDEHGVDVATETHVETTEGGYVSYWWLGEVGMELERRRKKAAKQRRMVGAGGRGKRGAVKGRRAFRGRGVERDERGRFVRRGQKVEVEVERARGQELEEGGKWWSTVLDRWMGEGEGEETITVRVVRVVMVEGEVKEEREHREDPEDDGLGPLYD